MKPGKFIVIEGGEGTGKTTLIKNLKECLDPVSFVFTREPGGTPFAEEMRKVIFANNDDPFKELCLFFAARRDHILKCIRPALASGKHVICDRYVASTYAYQIVAPKNWHLEECFGTFVHCAESSIDPTSDNTLHTNYLWLDGDVAICLGRRRGQGGQNSFDSRPLEFHQGVRRGFRHFFEYSEGRKMHIRELSWFKINAEVPEGDVLHEVFKTICKIIPEAKLV